DSDQRGLSTAQHSTIPSVCLHRRPFLLGLILAFHEVDRPEIARDGNENILNRCLSRTATSSALGSSLHLPAIPGSLPVHSRWKQSLGQRSNRQRRPTRLRQQLPRTACGIVWPAQLTCSSASNPFGYSGRSPFGPVGLWCSRP